jgi:hypothetical protein
MPNASSTVVPMKLVSLDNQSDVPTMPSEPSSGAITNSTRPLLLSTQNNLQKPFSNYPSLDRELYEIITNKEIPWQAKWRIYLAILRKDRLINDKQMWKEPVLIHVNEYGRRKRKLPTNDKIDQRKRVRFQNVPESNESDLDRNQQVLKTNSAI